MPLNPLNHHYAMENPASVYDEEAMTALELAGRTTAKVNECVTQVNKNTEALPGLVAQDVQKHINNGAFDRQIDKYAGDIRSDMEAIDHKLSEDINNTAEYVNRRIDNMLSHIPEGGTTMDAEVVDIRLDPFGTTHTSAGKAVREMAKDAHNMYTAYAYLGAGKSVILTPNDNGSVTVYIGGRLTYYSNKGYGIIPWDETTLSHILDYEESVPNYQSSHIITVPATKSLVYNTRDKCYYMRNNATCDTYDILLVENSNANPLRGTLVDEWKYRNILANAKNVYSVRGAYMYMGATAKITFEPNVTTSGMDVTFSGRPTICYGSSYRNAGWTEAELAHIKDKVSWQDGVMCTINIPGWSTLCYNHKDNAWRIRSRANLQEGDIVAIALGYCQVLGGTLMDEWCIRYAQDIQTFLEAQNAGLNPPEGVKRYMELFNGSGKVENFLYFTDPHLCEGTGWETEFQAYKSYMKSVCDSVPVNFAVCGGDWLGNSDTMGGACLKLGMACAQMREVFGKFFPVVGNHDYNYQGYAYEGAEENTGTLTPATIRNLWVPEKKDPYYTFDGINTRFFVFDTGIDWYPEMDDYKRNQIAWFVDELLHREGENMAVFLHIYFNGNADTEPEPLASAIMGVIEAYNSRGTVTISDVEYTFANATGKIRFVMAGHNHADEIFTTGPVPVIEVTHTRDGDTPTFDLCMIDYDNNKLHLVRVGTGEDRTVDI